MLNHVGRVADDTGNEYLAVRQLDALPDLPFMLVTGIRRLDHIGAGPHLEDEIDDVLERDVAYMRPRPASPAHMVAHAILPDSFERAVERFDEFGEPAAIFLERTGRNHAVVRGGRTRIVDLQDEAGIDDRPVFRAHRRGDRVEPLLLALVVFILAVRQHARRRDHRHEGFFHLRALECSFEIVDVAPQDILPDIFHRTDAGDHLGVGHRLAHVELGVELLEAGPIGAGGTRAVAGRDRAQLEAAQALDNILVPTDRLAEFAVADDVDANVRLATDHVVYGLLQALLVGGLIVGLTGLLGTQDVLQRLRTNQASDVGGEDSVSASFHDFPFDASSVSRSKSRPPRNRAISLSS